MTSGSKILTVIKPGLLDISQVTLLALLNLNSVFDTVEHEIRLEHVTETAFSV